MSKHAVVHSDDPDKPRLTLIMSGPVIEFATVIPKRIVLRGVAGQPVRGAVTIIPKANYPFTIIGATARYGKKIQFKYEEIQKSDPKGYLLTVDNLQAHKGRFFDVILLKTDSRIRPEISIQVVGDILEAPPTGVPSP